ncbi:MAG: nitroreductase [Myxococcales bacterium]|nr:nitroreductase [Myxococcales bacterium]
MDTHKAIITRRTHKIFTGEAVTHGQIRELLELAVMAPNHRLTEPWRFVVVPHERIETFAGVVVDSIRDDEHERLLGKKRNLSEQLPKLGAFIHVAQTPNDDPITQKEDYASVCCAVQNIMLGATALGLGSFWSTGSVFLRDPVIAYLEVPQDWIPVASLWLGHPAGPAKSARKPATMMTTWVD